MMYFFDLNIMYFNNINYTPIGVEIYLSLSLQNKL